MLSITALYKQLDALILDANLRLVADSHYFKDALVIDIDDASLQELQTYFGEWPYKRSTYALLVDYLSEMGASVVAFDIIFSDPREGDERFGEAIARARNVVLAASTSSEVRSAGQPKAVLNELAWDAPPGLDAYAWSDVQLPLSTLTQQASALVSVGIISVVADRDGMFRRFPLFHRINGQYLPSLPLAVYFSGEPRPGIRINSDHTIQVGNRVWPIDEEGAAKLSFPRNINSVLTISFSRVAKAMLGLPGQELEPDLIRGKSIFIGSTAFYSDRVFTPAGEMTGVHLLAIAHQSLANNLLIAPRNWHWTSALLLVALLPSLLLMRQPRRSAMVGVKYGFSAACVIYGAYLTLLYVFKQESPLLLPLMVVLIANILEATRSVRLQNEDQKTEIHTLANDDPLTRLPNRFSLQGQLAHAIECARTTNGYLGVLLIGFNDFRTINSALGNEVGDHLLAEVATRLRASVQTGDIIARLGGDEFVVIILSDEIPAAKYAHALLSAVGQPYSLDGQELHISANIGISLYPSDGVDVATLLRQADTAMREAKAQGRNVSRFFTPDFSRAALERLLIENQLHQALDRGEMMLLYQPQIDMQSGRMVGVEALVRWNHPTQGLLGPDFFIYIAENSEFILPLGEWVLRTACQQMRVWQLAGLTHIERVAVNLSVRQFEQPGFPAIVASVLGETQLDACHLELEITESVALKDIRHSVETLSVLRDMGISLALDDFGTGYSSLTYFKLLPLTSIKIDKSFVRNIETDRYDAEICASTINLARKLGLRVVAEGIETSGQFNFLRNIKCHEAQGYLISRPLTAQDFAQFQLPAGLV